METKYLAFTESNPTTMKKNYLSIVAIWIAAMPVAMGQGTAPATSSSAESPEKRPDPLRIQVVVTDSKVEQAQKQVTQKVLVLDSTDIERSSDSRRNAAELLQYQPGLFVSVLSRNDANWGSYGGLGPKYNSYLLDGLPVDSFMDTMSLDPWVFERVEAHQGPASVLYSNYLSMDFAGNQTPLSGTTNLILKDEVEGQASRILLGGGSWATFNGRLYHQNRKGRLHYFFGAGYEQSDYTDYGTPGSWLNILEDPAYQKTKLYAKATWHLGKPGHKLSIFAQHTLHDGAAGRPNRDYSHNYDTVNLRYDHPWSSGWNLQFRTGYRRYDRRWGEDQYPASLALREHDGVVQDIVPVDLTLTRRHGGNSILTFGADGQAARYETYAEIDGVQRIGNDARALATGLFLQEKYVRGRWTLRAGGRFQHTGNTFDLLSGSKPGVREKSWDRGLWSAGVRYELSDTASLYSNVGTSFTAPAAKSVGGTLRLEDRGVPGRNGQLPNPDLRPEKGLGYDAGADLRLPHFITTGLRLFYNRIQDAIVENTVSRNPSQSQSVNAGEARSLGFQIPFEQAPSPFFRWFANLTYTSTRIENPLDRDQDGADISFVPDYVLNAGCTFQLQTRFSLSPYFQATGKYYDSTSWSGRRSFGSYRTVNLKLTRELFRSPEYGVELFLDLNNLTNRRYEMPWQFRDPGFNFFAGLQLKL